MRSAKCCTSSWVLGTHRRATGRPRNTHETSNKSTGFRSICRVVTDALGNSHAPEEGAGSRQLVMLVPESGAVEKKR